MLEDYFGKTLKAGQEIAYPVRRGSALWIEEATILEVLDASLKVIKPNGSKTTIKNTGNCFIKPHGGMKVEDDKSAELQSKRARTAKKGRKKWIGSMLWDTASDKIALSRKYN